MQRKFKNTYHLLVALLVNFLHGFPAQKLQVIGVTGTDGKTTTVNLIYHIFKQAKLPVSMISTTGAVIGNMTYDLGFHVTTPSSHAMQRFLKKAILTQEAKHTQNYIIIETTSHALDQNRVWGIPFSIGVLTNITHEHLDYHGSYEAYVAAKMKLLERSQLAIINSDDQSYPLVLEFLMKKKKNYQTYGIKNGKANVTPKTLSFAHHLPGAFNMYNVLAAVSVAKQVGVADTVIQKAIASFRLPVGRLETVYDKQFRIIIDFAHTPNAFAQLLPTVKKDVQKRLIHVFGCASERDDAKRPKMGEIAASYDDVIILTAEDPRKENIEKIHQEVVGGIKKSKKTPEVILTNRREEGITKAILLAKKGDTILITGKAHEKSMNYGRGEEAWDEHNAVKKALSMRKK